MRAEAASNLRNLAAEPQQVPEYRLAHRGHTDAVGSSEYNQSLSQRRSTAASNYLASQGVSATRLRAVGRGETEPIGPNDTEAGRQSNRRVEIAIVANATARTP